jgi:hypothetical protein
MAQYLAAQAGVALTGDVVTAAATMVEGYLRDNSLPPATPEPHKSTGDVLERARLAQEHRFGAATTDVPR